MAKGVDPQAWVVARLQSWAKWAKSGAVRSGYGESCLTLEEIRSMPVRAYVPVSPQECEQTHDAIRKLPEELQKLAAAWYVEELTQPLVGQRLGVTDRHVRRLHGSLLNGLEFCLRNPRVRQPPLYLLLKSRPG